MLDNRVLAELRACLWSDLWQLRKFNLTPSQLIILHIESFWPVLPCKFSQIGISLCQWFRRFNQNVLSNQGWALVSEVENVAALNIGPLRFNHLFTK